MTDLMIFLVLFAWDFYDHFSKLGNKLVMTETDEEIIIPKSTKRKGPMSAFRSFDNFLKKRSLWQNKFMKSVVFPMRKY